jgi:hypothetical protein
MLKAKKAKLFTCAEDFALDAAVLGNFPLLATFQIVLALGSTFQKLQNKKRDNLYFCIKKNLTGVTFRMPHCPLSNAIFTSLWVVSYRQRGRQPAGICLFWQQLWRRTLAWSNGRQGMNWGGMPQDGEEVEVEGGNEDEEGGV